MPFLQQTAGAGGGGGGGALQFVAVLQVPVIVTWVAVVGQLDKQLYVVAPNLQQTCVGGGGGGGGALQFVAVLHVPVIGTDVAGAVQDEAHM